MWGVVKVCGWESCVEVKLLVERFAARTYTQATQALSEIQV